ncbi:MAG: hypothetical protein MK075_02090 [Phycisphaerales bacterium]|nr:hypothetical protein [Phycisphaerales bacterium]
MNWTRFAFCSLALAAPATVSANESVARRWNELLLESIRNDFARPTVHARNLFHTSAAMWDAWSCFEDGPAPWLFNESIIPTGNIEASRETAISHAVFGLLTHRFAQSPGADTMLPAYENLMVSLGLDPTNDTLLGNSPAAVGNRIAEAYIQFGLADSSNEVNDYENLEYEPINPALYPDEPGNPDLVFPNRWQPLGFEEFVDQSGNVIEGGIPPFLSPEWGAVVPFSLQPDQRTVYERDGSDWSVYLDPGAPPLLGGDRELEYLEGFEQVLIWSSHLDHTDQVDWDISPNSIGNATLPTDPADFIDFYDVLNGGDDSQGYSVNPVTGEAFPVQMVPRGDYGRVLAEFWADGPDSETPPGHWFTLLNDVMDHPSFVRKMGGQGPVLSELEFDVKAYFALGGCMHDVAITAWGVKGYYDYVRPVSVVRWMAQNGQRTSPFLPNYSPQGLQIIPGLIEQITQASAAPGERHNHLVSSSADIGKMAAFAWRGPDFINDPTVDSGLRLYYGGELVALPTAFFCHSKLCGLCVGPFHLQPSRGRVADPVDRKSVLSRRCGRICRRSKSVLGL